MAIPMSTQISARELDLIIKELERLNDCYLQLSTRLDTRIDNKQDKAGMKWIYTLVFGSFAFTLFILGLILKLHLGV